MQKDRFDRVLSFLLGASWGIIIFGALLIFNIFSSLGLPLAIFITIFFIIISLFFVLLLDAFSINREKLTEMKKQTKLLEKLYAKHTN
jgi:uncharacterized membrane protein (DUF106 family)